MKRLTFTEWTDHWGGHRLEERIAQSQRRHQRLWKIRNGSAQYPAWELCLGSFWSESLSDWHERWILCGGKLSDGRMIAAKWDTIWGRIGTTFFDGIGNPYPPYSPSSCAYWRNIDQDEAIVSGAITEEDLKDHLSLFECQNRKYKEDRSDSNETIKKLRADLLERGPKLRATKEERVANRKKLLETALARANSTYEESCANRERERVCRNSTFRLLEQIEESLKTDVSFADSKKWKWLCESVTELTATVHFDSYPNWVARAWLLAAELHKVQSDHQNELSCLKYALSKNERLPIRRRIKKLEREIEKTKDAI